MALLDAVRSTYCPLRNPFEKGSVVHLSLVTQLSHQCLLFPQCRSSCTVTDDASRRRLQVNFMCPSRTLQDGTEAHMKPMVSSVILCMSVDMNACGPRKSYHKTHTVMSK